MDIEAPQSIEAPPSPEPTVNPLRFNGNGAEYFRIWIVNLMLTIVTLGIYSAWAKVRRLQYFYRNTELAGTGFEYHGQPKAILVGRAIALLMFLAYQYSAEVSLWLFGVVVVVLLVVWPWLLHNSLRFRLHNSSYRGLRFQFVGSLGGTYLASYRQLVIMLVMFAAVGLLALVSKTAATFAGFAAALAVVFWVYPAWYRDFKQFQHNHTQYGQQRFQFSTTIRKFSWIFSMVFLQAIVIFIVAAITIAALGIEFPKAGAEADGAPSPKGFKSIAILLTFVYGGLFLVCIPYFRARVDNLIWNNTRFDGGHFESRQEAHKLAGIYFTNLIGVALTLGFFMPWAMVRLARYRAECLSLTLTAPLDDIVAAPSDEVGAIGEEAGSVFDIDVAL
ncbi:YjgN family protein [Nevskia sp.]|uniref:YjgN family protein n=1 Tax=Nevskia sp. TaxID=1929292 RepID=UPI0025F1E4E2|nr:YjgN family protein [Nevskia sp.]